MKKWNMVCSIAGKKELSALTLIPSLQQISCALFGDKKFKGRFATDFHWNEGLSDLDPYSQTFLVLWASTLQPWFENTQMHFRKMTVKKLMKLDHTIS